jgi:hypothetical protein
LALPVSDYVAEFKVESSGPERSIIVWAADFNVTSGDEEQATAMVHQFLDAGLGKIEQTYASQTGLNEVPNDTGDSTMPPR